MLFQPKRIIHATTEQEIDAALESADQVIVEGDDRLLSYALGKASVDPQNKITVETGEITTTIRPADDTPAVNKWKWGKRFLLLLLFFGLCGLASLLLVYHETPLQNVAKGAGPVIGEPAGGPPAPPRPPALPRAPSEGVSVPSEGELPPSQPPASNDYMLTLIQTLAWPAVTIVSIAALLLIAWKAIGAGRNVEITWKVTEKVQGRVVIQKAQARTRKPRAQTAAS
jgi:hypothetical protein